MKKVLGALATVLAAPFLVSFPLYRREIVRARARIVAGSVLAQTACGPIEYASAGEGPVLVAVHGAGGGWDQGIDLAGELAASGFRVVAPSRFGYLRTPLPRDASAEAQADAHASLLDALGVRRAAILGASAGAPSALQFAIRHPDRCAALVLMVPAAFTPRPGNAPSVRTPSGVPAVFGTALRWDYLFWLFERLLRPLAVRTIMGTPTGVVARAGRSERDRVDMMLRHILPVSARRLGLVNDAAVVSTLRRYDLESISAPTLVFAAPDCGYGTWKPASYTAAHIRGARFVGFPSGGHLLVGHETEILAGIANFLREVTKDPGS
ncbi:MAG TPA: alpha/beta hydrolase [Thermoanaerobaculia bacterium]|nr:alpha/beta hydrolase [Thermoanaerobaculia bacterium]